MIYLLFINFITLYAYTYVGEAPCSSITVQADCGSTVITGKGWCYWDGTIAPGYCYILPCYLIDEVAACRTGSGMPTGGATALCDSLEAFSLQYDNVCCDKNLGKLNYAFVRYTMNFDGYVDRTNDATPILMTALDVSIDVKTMFKLYTINPWIASNAATEAVFKQQLTDILAKYVSSSPTLLTQQRSHPFYMERTVYQSLQLLRDWVVKNRTPSTSTLKADLLPRIWSVALLALTRMTTFQPNFYQTTYYFINFAIIPYFRNSLKISGQLHTVTIDWSTYSYASNGFVMVYSYPAEQFGIINTYTDVFCIRPFLGTTVAYVGTENNYDNLFGPLTFTYYWTDTTLSIVQANLILYKIGDTADEASVVATAATFSCTLTSRTCTTTYNPLPLTLGKGQNYFIGLNTLGAVTDKKRAQCLLAFKTWTVSSSTCS